MTANSSPKVDMQQTDPFFSHGNLDRAQSLRTLEDALHGADDGELYLEHRSSESYMFDDGRLKQASGDTSQGFGLRAVKGETTAYAHSAELTDAALKRAASTVQAVDNGQANVSTKLEPAFGANKHLYVEQNPLAAIEFAQKLAVLQAIDAYLRAKDSRVKQVTATLAANWSRVQILRADGRMASDVRPLVRLSIQAVVGDGTKMESGGSGAGGRY
ncbi:MAG TPA: DNA gyrase modulator, partial [Kofleriaceae bacterium]|nr:DNA gyrase modulator [Kofleriaceae bacterium]